MTAYTQLPNATEVRPRVRRKWPFIPAGIVCASPRSSALSKIAADDEIYSPAADVSGLLGFSVRLAEFRPLSSFSSSSSTSLFPLRAVLFSRFVIVPVYEETGKLSSPFSRFKFSSDDKKARERQKTIEASFYFLYTFVSRTFVVCRSKPPGLCHFVGRTLLGLSRK